MKGEQGRRIVKSASLRTRFTPTFYHHDIFGTSQPLNSPSHVRVTPTFHSTFFDYNSYQIQTHHSRPLQVKEQPQQHPEPHIYINSSRQRKQAFLNPCMLYTNNQDQHYVDGKEKLINNINHLQGRTSRLRKCVEQMSNPIFGGFTWNILPQSQEHPHKYDPNEYRQACKQQIKEQPHQQKDSLQVQKLHQNIVPPQKQIQARPKAKQKENSQSKGSKKHVSNLKRFKSATTLRVKDKK